MPRKDSHLAQDHLSSYPPQVEIGYLEHLPFPHIWCIRGQNLLRQRVQNGTGGVGKWPVALHPSPIFGGTSQPCQHNYREREREERTVKLLC